MPDIEATRDLLVRQRDRLEARIEERTEQIEALKHENSEDDARIKRVDAAIAQINPILDALAELGPLDDEVTETINSGRVPQKKLVDPVIKGAETSGIPFDEIIACVKRMHGIDLKPMSLKSYLAKGRAEGLYEQRDDGRWRLAPAMARAAAD